MTSTQRCVPSVLLPFPVTIVICWLVSQASSSPSLQVHRRFARADLQQIFHVENHDDVPEYDVVRIRMLVKRDTDKSKHIHLAAFGEDIQLRLDHNSHLAESAKRLKVLVADVKDGKLNITEESAENGTLEVGEPYHDVEKMAAVTIHHDSLGNVQMEGTIGRTLVIKPAPLHVKEELQRIIDSTADDEMFLDAEYPLTSNSSSLNNISKNSIQDIRNEGSNDIHIVYKTKDEQLQGGSDYLFMEPDLTAAPQRKWLRHKREAPETIWPEVLVIADYDTFNMHGANSVNIKRYFVSFWNGVDLRYKLLTGPRVRISLAGIIISKGRDATPYLENNRVKGDAVDSAAALTDMGKYLFRERRLPTYDLAVVVTKLDLCRKQFQSATCNTGTAGFAYVGGACVVNSRLEKVNSVAIVEDTGGFSGIIVAAHEVGHLLGAVHDGSPAPSYLGGPGAEHCRWEDGFIMSDLRHTERGFQWSSCSIEQFRHFLNSDTATCLHNVPHEDEELPRILPGKMLSLDAQCRKDRGTSACFKDDRVCAQLFCFDSKSGYCVSYRPAAEGSPCGDGQHCISGRCVMEHDNYIPDFTKISEVVVDKPDTAATEIKPLFSKPDGPTTTPKDKKHKVEDTTASARVTTARSKFRYNTVFRKLSTTSKTTFDSDVNARHDNITDRHDEKNEALCDDVMQTLAGG